MRAAIAVIAIACACGKHGAAGAFPAHPTSVHEDARGEMYVTDSSGFVYHVEAGP